MKKLNKKGFTLIELLAVIVVLAIILVLTIPNVLNSMQSARQGAFDDALMIIKDYAQKQYDLCKLGDSTLQVGDLKNNNFSSTTSCAFTTNYSDIVVNAGYKTSDISNLALTVNGNKVVISNATAASNGKFNGATFNSDKVN